MAEPSGGSESGQGPRSVTPDMPGAPIVLELGGEGLEYVGLMADSWDAARGDTSGWADRAFFLDLIHESGEPVLDVGCGTGRLLLDYLAHGIDIDGVDASPDMIAICRRKAEAAGAEVRLFVQRMEELDLPRRYGTILVPSSSFQLVVDPANAAAAVERLYAHLAHDGALSMPFIMRMDGDARDGARDIAMSDGSIVRRTSRTSYDSATQLESTDELYELVRDGAVVRSQHHVRPRATRSYTVDQIEALFEDAGFDELEWYSGFTLEPYHAGDEIASVVARRG